MLKPPYRALQVALRIFSVLLAIGALFMIFSSRALVVRGQLQHFVSLFITGQRRHHLQKSLGMRFNHCSLDFQSGDYALKLFLHGP